MSSFSTFMASLLGRILMVVAVLLLITFGVTQCQSARVAGKKADLSADQGRAGVASAKDAVSTIGAAHQREAAGDDLTRENGNAIDQAEGAAAPVNPAVRDAGLIGLCRRAAYRGSEQCLQFTPSR